MRLACGYDAEYMTYVELSQDVVDCFYSEGNLATFKLGIRGGGGGWLFSDA